MVSCILIQHILFHPIKTWGRSDKFYSLILFIKITSRKKEYLREIIQQRKVDLWSFTYLLLPKWLDAQCNNDGAMVMGHKIHFSFCASRCINVYVGPTDSRLWHKVPTQKAPQTKMFILSNQVNTYSVDWSSWKANASTQEWLYKTTDVIISEGVDLKSLNNFIYFCTQSTEKGVFADFSHTRKKIWMPRTVPNIYLLL